jgi:hypothetical protein
MIKRGYISFENSGGMENRLESGSLSGQNGIAPQTPKYCHRYLADLSIAPSLAN